MYTYKYIYKNGYRYKYMYSILPKLFPGRFMGSTCLILHGECFFQLKPQILEQTSFFFISHPTNDVSYNTLLHEEKKWKQLLAGSGTLNLRVKT